MLSCPLPSINYYSFDNHFHMTEINVLLPINCKEECLYYVPNNNTIDVNRKKDIDQKTVFTPYFDNQ